MSLPGSIGSKPLASSASTASATGSSSRTHWISPVVTFALDADGSGAAASAGWLRLTRGEDAADDRGHRDDADADRDALLLADCHVLCLSLGW